MTSPSQHAAEFYDDLAEHYDAMMGFDNRLAAAAQWVQAYRRRHDFSVAVDIGCGTGAYALAMAQCGAQSLGMDISSAMLKMAQANAEQHQLVVRFVQAGLETAAAHIETPADLIVCMGNTLPHILSPNQLVESLTELAKKLTPNGRLVLQLLNYEKILADRERLVGVTRNGDLEFIRFYDFLDPLVRFNLLEINWRGGVPQTRLDATKLYPYQYEELQSLLGKAGFGRMDAFGGLDFSGFTPLSSETLMLVAGR